MTCVLFIKLIPLLYLCQNQASQILWTHHGIVNICFSLSVKDSCGLSTAQYPYDFSPQTCLHMFILIYLHHEPPQTVSKPDVETGLETVFCGWWLPVWKPALYKQVLSALSKSSDLMVSRRLQNQAGSVWKLVGNRSEAGQMWLQELSFRIGFGSHCDAHS